MRADLQSRTVLLGGATVLTAWLLLTVVSASGYYLDGLIRPEHSWFRTVLQFGSIWSLWFFIVPIIGWTTRRFPLEEGRWVKALGVHLLISTVWAPIYFALTLIVIRLWAKVPVFEDFWGGLSAYNFRSINEAFIYWVLAVAAYAFWHFEERRLEQRRSAELLLRNAEIRKELTQAELRTLRDQLHPHFLFNTLNSIAGLIRTDDRDSALQVLSQLSDLLRYSLEAERKPLVPVQEEVGFVRRYLAIQQTRFRDRLTVNITIDGDTSELVLPSMILQPLVENAVHHGVISTRKDNQVSVHIRPDKERLIITISNTTGENSEDRSGFGIGIENVRRRLQHLYSGDFQFELNREATGSTIATLDLPAWKAGNAPVAEETE